MPKKMSVSPAADKLNATRLRFNGPLSPEADMPVVRSPIATRLQRRAQEIEKNKTTMGVFGQHLKALASSRRAAEPTSRPPPTLAPLEQEASFITLRRPASASIKAEAERAGFTGDDWQREYQFHLFQKQHPIEQKIEPKIIKGLLKAERQMLALQLGLDPNGGRDELGKRLNQYYENVPEASANVNVDVVASMVEPADPPRAPFTEGTSI
jgi:hypothetical protein